MAPPWSSERRPDHQIHELVAGIPHRRQLQAFFRAEVGKQSALRHVRQFGEGPDGDASKSHLTRRAGRLVQHSLPGELTLAHQALIARSFVRCKTPVLEARDPLSDHRNADHEKQDGHDRGVVVSQPLPQPVQGPAIRAEAIR